MKPRNSIILQHNPRKNLSQKLKLQCYVVSYSNEFSLLCVILQRTKF